MMEELLQVVPSFRPEWEKFLVHWKEEDDDLPLYIAISDLACHLIGMLEHGEIETFPAVFETIERLQLEGEHYVQEATVIGVLESLQNWNFHKTTKPEQFEPFFGPETKVSWEELHKFWADVREAKKAGLLKPKPLLMEQVEWDGEIITVDQMMEYLLGVIPSFRPNLEAFVEEWKTNKYGPPHFLALNFLAHHLIHMLERGELKTFPTVFTMIERLFIEGNYSVRTTILTGLLDEMQNIKHYTSMNPGKFEAYMGPFTLDSWNAIRYY